MLDIRHKRKWILISAIGDWEYCIKNSSFIEDSEPTEIAPKNDFKMDAEIFSSCPFKDKIFKNYTVDCIILGGSSLYEAYDDVSDFDLDIFIEEQDYHADEDECLFYKGRKVHWYYNSISNMLQGNKIVDAEYMIDLNFLKLKNFIYINNDTISNYILENKDTIALIGFYKLAKKEFNLLDKAKDYSILRSDLKYKHFGVFALYYYILTGNTVDKYIVLKLKRCKYVNISKEEVIKINDIFHYLYNYLFYIYNELDQKINELTDNLLNCIKENLC